MAEPEDFQDDLTRELEDLVPPSWYSPDAKISGGSFQALMAGMASMFAFVRVQIDTLKKQMRVATAIKDGLDVIAVDFFGTNPAFAMPRKLISTIFTSDDNTGFGEGGFGEGGFFSTTPGVGFVPEDDESYRHRIQAELLRERGTVRGITEAIQSVTGAAPSIVEPFSTLSVGVVGGSNLAGVKYNSGVIGVLGSTSTAQFNGPNAGPNPQTGYTGWGDRGAIYLFFATITNNPMGASREAILSVIERTRPAAVRAIVNITA